MSLKNLSSHYLYEKRNPSRDYKIWIPDLTNPYEWHFSLKGPTGTNYEGGIYHGKLVLPKEFPFKAPRIEMLTPSGRFETNTRLCISGLTDYHQETWSPATKIGSIIIGLTSFFDDTSSGDGIGFIRSPDAAKVKEYAIESVKYTCPKCKIVHSEVDWEEDIRKLEAIQKKKRLQKANSEASSAATTEPSTPVVQTSAESSPARPKDENSNENNEK